MIFFSVAMIAIWIGLTIIGFIPGLIFITFPLHMIVWLGSFIVWIILLIKANQGLMYKLPVNWRPGREAGQRVIGQDESNTTCRHFTNYRPPSLHTRGGRSISFP